jgi:protein-disulfide isomerase
MNKSLILACALVALLGACGTPSNPPQSPTNDQQPPSTTTGNGEVIGADGVAPAQKLQEGVQVDSQDGVKPAAQPPAE